MKFSFIALAVFSAQLLFAAGEPFDVVKDGYVFHCTAQGSSQPGGALDCVNKAYAGPFSKDEAMGLCQGAVNTGPADCALAAYAGPLNKAQAISLCRRAYSAGPFECYSKAYSGPFNSTESLELCSVSGSAATADCAIRAYAGPYNKQQAISLCKGGNAALLNTVLAQVHDEQTVGFEKVLHKALLKAEARHELMK